MHALAKGENLALPSGRAVLIASGGGAALRVLALDGADQAMGAPLEPGGWLPGVRSRGADRVELDLGAAGEMQSLLIILAVPADGGPMPASPAGRLAVLDDGGAVLAQYTHGGLADERALILGEVYQRAGQWKVRAVGQGYRGGLPELLARHGGAPVDLAGEQGAMAGEQEAATATAATEATATAATGAAALDRTLAAEQQVRILNGVFEDAARATAGYRAAIEFAQRRRERELAQLLDDPRRRRSDDPERADIDARFDALVMRAGAEHHRGIEQLRAELSELEPSLAPQLAPWGSPAWRRAQRETAGRGVRIGEVVLPEAPDLRVPLVVPFPLGRPVWLDGRGEDVAATARGLVVRMLAASAPGDLRIRCVGAGVSSHVLAGADSAGPGCGWPAGPDEGLASALRQLVHRADLLQMARTAGADALPPDLFVGHVVLLCGQPEIDGDALDGLRVLAQPGARVSIVLLGRDGEAAAARIDALPIIAGQDVELTDGWVGLRWTYRPDPGPTDAQVAALPPLR